MSQYKLVPERLRLAREALNITKAEASRKVGLTNIGYNRYESGERNPSIQMIQSLAESLNTSKNYLIGISDDPTPDSIRIERSEGVELFDLAMEYVKGDIYMKMRILAYAKAFWKQES